MDRNAAGSPMRGVRRFWPAAVIVLIAIAFCVAWLAHLDYDVSGFVRAGDMFTDAAHAPECLTVAAGSGGYDGQFFYRLAIAPFSTEQAHAGMRFDYAVYRGQRILYPLLAFLFSGGDPCVALWMLPLVSVAALALLAGSAVPLLETSKVPAGFAVVAALWPGFLFSLARDLAEPLAVALLISGLLAASRRATVPAALLLSLAALTRETTVLAGLALSLYAVIASIRKRGFDPFIVAGALPLLVHVGWKRLLFARWELPVHWGVTSAAGIPFEAFIALMRQSWMRDDHAGRVQFIELLAFALFPILVLLALWRSTIDARIRFCCAAYFLFVFGLSGGIWVEDWAFLRATAEFGVLGALVVITSTRWLRRAGGLLLVSSFAGLAFEMLRFR